MPCEETKESAERNSNRENRSGPMEDSRQATERSGAHSHAEAPPRSRTSYEPNHKERRTAGPSRAGWTSTITPEADATSGARLPTGPHVISVPDFTTVSHDTTVYASLVELQTGLLRRLLLNSRSLLRGERSRRTRKKPKSYRDESGCCIDYWIELMKFHFEEENLSKKQEFSALTDNLEGTALGCVMAKRTNERDSARKIFNILLNRFDSGEQGRQAMVKFEKRRQRDDRQVFG